MGIRSRATKAAARIERMDAESRSKGQDGKGRPRLSKTYDYDRAWLDRSWRGAQSESSDTRSDARGDLIVAWERVGLNALGLYLHLHQAGLARIQYERRRQRIADEKKVGARERQRMRRVLDGAEPLIRLLSTQADGAEDADRSKTLEGLEALIARYRADLDVVHPEKLPPNRPGEPWLTDPVLILAEHLRGAGLGWKRTVRLIYDAFRTVQMADVVTRDSIWSILRRAKAGTPDFRGKLLPTKCTWCSSGPSGIGQAIEDMSYVLANASPERLERLGRKVRAGSRRIIREAQRKLVALSRKQRRARRQLNARRLRDDLEYVRKVYSELSPKRL